MTSLFVLRMMCGEIHSQGYLKLVKGEPMDTFPLKLVDLATGETKRFLNEKSKTQLKALRIAVREFNKKVADKETE